MSAPTSTPSSSSASQAVVSRPKRKAAAVVATELDEAGGELELAGGDALDDGQDDADDEHADQKVKDDKGKGKTKAKAKKKVLTKKVAVWADLREWKDGDDPLGIFPVEVLDLIISGDSALSLRDYLALAATCRFFRSCYRDDVFRVLYHDRFPGEHLAPYPFRSYFSKPHGPFLRSFSCARRLFSSGRSLVGAGGWSGWGLKPDDYAANQLVVHQQKYELERALKDLCNNCPITWTEHKWGQEAERQAESHSDFDEADDETVKASRIAGVRRELLRVDLKKHELLREAHGLQRDPKVANELIDYLSNEPPVETPRLYDPWPSFWRDKVTTAVNRPAITKTEAKKRYKVTDSELLSLTQVAPPRQVRAGSICYRKAAVQALALRSHGGPTGHKQYLSKIKVASTKAKETRTKNGHTKIAVLPSHSESDQSDDDPDL